MQGPFSPANFMTIGAIEWAQVTPPKAVSVGATMSHEQSSRVASQKPDRSRVFPPRISRNRWSMRSKPLSPPRVRPMSLARYLASMFMGTPSACSLQGWSGESFSLHEKMLDAIERVTISKETIDIRLSDPVAADGRDRTLALPWIPPFPYQRREIIQGEGEPRPLVRPMRVRARAVFAESLRNAHVWLDELIKDPDQTLAGIAAREQKSERSIRMTLSLAFVAPPIVAAAIEGSLPRGIGSKRLIDLTDGVVTPMGCAGARGFNRLRAARTANKSGPTSA